MVCSNCGANLRASAKYCKKCGMKILPENSPGEIYNDFVSPSDATTVIISETSGVSPADADTLQLASEHPEAAAAAYAAASGCSSAGAHAQKPKVLLKIIIAAGLLALGFVSGIIFEAIASPDIRTLLNQAERFFDEGNYGYALDEYDKVLKIDPNNIEASIGSAKCCYAKGDKEKAGEILIKAYKETENEALKLVLEKLE